MLTVARRKNFLCSAENVLKFKYRMKVRMLNNAYFERSNMKSNRLKQKACSFNSMSLNFFLLS